MCPRRGVTRLSRPDMRSQSHHESSSLLLQAALSLGRRLRRRLGRVEGPSNFTIATVFHRVGFEQKRSKAHPGRPLDGRPTPLCNVSDGIRRSPQGSASPASGRPNGSVSAFRSAETLSPSRQQVSTWPPRCLELYVKNVPLLVGEEAMTAGGMSCHRALTIRARKSSSGSWRWTEGRRRA
jgi:hypothetical protein